MVKRVKFGATAYVIKSYSHNGQAKQPSTVEATQIAAFSPGFRAILSDAGEMVGFTLHGKDVPPGTTNEHLKGAVSNAGTSVGLLSLTQAEREEFDDLLRQSGQVPHTTYGEQLAAFRERVISQALVRHINVTKTGQGTQAQFLVELAD
jgi:hypothetical protein